MFGIGATGLMCRRALPFRDASMRPTPHENSALALFECQLLLFKLGL